MSPREENHKNPASFDKLVAHRLDEKHDEFPSTEDVSGCCSCCCCCGAGGGTKLKY